MDERSSSRSHLRAFLSTDEGQTWEGGLLLDERTAVSYPDGFQAADGLITIVYDRNRAQDREILMSRFTESDIMSGAFSGAESRRQLLVHKATGPAASNHINH